MPWQDFALAFEITNRALEYLDGPAVKPPFVRPAAPSPGRQDPVLWTSIAVARHFGRNYPYLISFQRRYWGLMHLVDGGFVDEWVLADDGEGPRRLHPALLLAAAEVKLTRNGRFPPRRFAARVAEIIRTELDEPPAEGGD